MAGKSKGPYEQLHVEQRENSQIGRMRRLQTMSEYRLSIRLTRLEMARVDYLLEWLQGKFPKNAKVGQKTLFLEALDALDWCNREDARKAGKKVIQVTITYEIKPDGVDIRHIDNLVGLPQGINRVPTNLSVNDVVYLFVRAGWQQVSTSQDDTLVFEKVS